MKRGNLWGGWLVVVMATCGGPEIGIQAGAGDSGPTDPRIPGQAVASSAIRPDSAGPGLRAAPGRSPLACRQSLDCAFGSFCERGTCLTAECHEARPCGTDEVCVYEDAVAETNGIGHCVEIEPPVIERSLTGDFDGDGLPDDLLLVRDGASPERRSVLALLGNGLHFRLDQDDLIQYPTWASWQLHPQDRPVGSGHESPRPPVLYGDGIVIANPESPRSLVYWNGERFVSTWLED